MEALSALQAYNCLAYSITINLFYRFLFFYFMELKRSCKQTKTEVGYRSLLVKIIPLKKLHSNYSFL